MAEDHGAWAYAVAEAIEGGVLDGLAGVAGQPVRTVTAAGLTAAVSAVDLADFGEQALRRNLEDLAWLEAAAWAHHHVIEAIAHHTPVVPMRLATVYRGDESVADMLAERRYDFEAALTTVRARTEWGVKVYVRQPDSTPAATPDTGSTSPGAAYLRRRKSELSASEGARRAAAASAEDIHIALRDRAVAALLRAPQGQQLSGQAGQMILNSAYLVDDDRAEGWSAAVTELAGRHADVRVELTGPWPPYSFAAIEEKPLSRQDSGPSAGAASPSGDRRSGRARLPADDGARP
jgi:gas vesicle protein GvpL/GvpF